MENRKTRRIYAAVLVLILLSGGCGVHNTVVNYSMSNEQITTVTFFGNKYEPENVTVIEEIISDFMDLNPQIRVSYESLKGSEYYDALAKRMAAGKGDDVFMVNHDICLELQAKGQLADLSGLDGLSNYSDQMRSQMEENGKIYWVPTTVSAFGLYCNLDLLEEHGQNVPQNLKEWRAVCDYFTERGITPVIANNDISLKTLAIGRSFHSIYQENRQKEVFNRLNRGEEMLSQYLEYGFSLVMEFIEKGYVDAEKALNTKKTSDDLEEFVKGETPFMLTGAWAAGRVEGMNPGFDFEVVPYPALDDGVLVVMNADTRLSVNADSEHLENAMRFVEYFTQTENIQKFVNQQSSFSPLKDGSPSYIREIQPMIACYQSGDTVIGTDSLLNLPIWEWTAEVSQKLLAGETLHEAMDWLDHQVAPERQTP